MSIQEILTQVKSGALSLSAAEALIRENPAERSYEEMGFAKLDTDRKKRSGFAEVIYCQGKSDEFIGQIFRRLYEVEGEVFGTRASPHQYPEAGKGEGAHRLRGHLHGRHGRYFRRRGSGTDGRVLRDACRTCL